MSSSKRGYPVLLWFAWTLATWLTLAGSVYFLCSDLENIPWHWWLVVTLPPAAVICAWRGVRAGAQLGRWARVIFWAGTLTGAGLTALLLQGQMENLQHEYYRDLLMAGIAMPLLALVFVGIREVRTGEFKGAGFGWMVDIAGGAACIATVLASGYFIWLKAFVEPLRARAEARWAEIRRPMEEFGKTMHPVAENDSLRELTRDLKPFGLVSFYKTGSGGGRITAETKIGMPNEVFDFVANTEKGYGDSVKLPAKASAALDANKADFDRLYSGILRRDPPVWELDRGTGFDMLVPNYLATRILGQWISADVYHRLEQGDEKGAADAVAAEMRIVRNMGKQPILVSIMIDVAVESLFAPVVARLPEDPGAMAQLKADVETKRHEFEISLQAEVWSMMHIFEKTKPTMQDMQGWLAPNQPWPKWLQGYLLPVYCHSYWRLECYKAWLIQADVVALCSRAGNLPDLGVQELEDLGNREQSLFTPNYARAWMRINAALLIREQAEMIRMARAQMQAGKSGKLGEYQSVVIPGSKWVVTGDAAAKTVTLKFAPVPKWIAENEVTPDEFWLMPLDGSKPWQLRLPADKISAAY